MQRSPLANLKRGPVLATLASVVDTDTESQLSYASGAKSTKPVIKAAWKGGKKVSVASNIRNFRLSGVVKAHTVLQVDEENFLHMQEEYYRLKQAEKANEEIMRQ